MKLLLDTHTLLWFALNDQRLSSTAIDLNGFAYLHIDPRHTASLVTLPYHHRDPFDRLLIVQALVENLTLVSWDQTFDLYSVDRIW